MTASARRLWPLGGTMIAALLAAQSYGAEEPMVKNDKSPRLVVFVCEHGSAKSLVAASFFERMAKETWRRRTRRLARHGS